MGSEEKGQIFAQNYKQWVDLDTYQTDFGVEKQITTQDWHYAVSLCNVEMLPN